MAKNASAGDIKKAYYGLAKKYHPDTNKDASAKDKFTEAQAAYELLSDAKKREAYDTYGSAAFNGTGFDPGAASGGNRTDVRVNPTSWQRQEHSRFEAIDRPTSLPVSMRFLRERRLPQEPCP